MAADILYLDDLALRLAANFAFDYLLVRATAEVTGRQVPGRRLALAALVGTAHDLAYLLAQHGVMPGPHLFRLWPVLLASSLAMLAVAFGPLPWRQFASVAGRFYATGFTAAGAGLAAASAFGLPGAPHRLLGMAVACVALIAMAEVGWDVAQMRAWQRLYLAPLRVRFGDQTALLTALVDTGNRLRDPLSASPVIVVEAAALEAILPPAVRQALAGCARGEWQDVGRLLGASPWATRFRLIPFTTLSRSGGLLLGFRPDEVWIYADGAPHPAREAVIGLCPHRLDPGGAYQALLHPEALAPEPVAVRPRWLPRHASSPYLGRERDTAC